MPDGRLVTYDLVAHKPAVTLVPLDGGNRIWFVRQYRVGAQEHLIELPAGVMEPGEDPQECAAREIREEIGMAADELTKIGEFYMAPGYSSEFMHVFLARGLHSAPLGRDEDEFLETISIPVGDVFAMAAAGEIRDGKSLAALFLARERLGK
jgi:ADP-ribose pyrophosphatase